MRQDRIDRVLSELHEMGLSQMLITDPRSIDYLTGVYVAPFERFFALFLTATGKHTLFVNALFNIPADLPLKTICYTDTDDVTPLLMSVIDPGTPLGVDKDIKARFLLPLMAQNAASAFVNASFAVDITRGVKDNAERDLMRTASRINDQAMAQFKTLVRPGITEKQIADQMLAIYQSLGAEDYSFSPIVSFGANAADPHHEPDNTPLQEGDCILFDVGCRKDSYCSDMTRTFYYHHADEHDRAVYDLVRRANEAAEALVRPGVPLRELDAAARTLITDAGYGPAFNHRLGHFIGLNEHEFGDVSASSEWIARPGMIFSIEPGIYLPRDTGVRIEDLVLVTEDGCEILNHYPKSLEIIPGADA